jgi:hypothetical protein
MPFGWLQTYFCKFLRLSQRQSTDWRIQRPGLLHSLVGFITTIINIYTAQGGHWSVTAKITIIVIGLYTGNMSVLYLVYNHWILEKVKTTRNKALAKQNHT